MMAWDQASDVKFKRDSAQRSSNKCKKYLPKNYS